MKGDKANQILDEEEDNGDGVDGTSPAKPIVGGKQGNKASILPQQIKTTNLTLQNNSANKQSSTNKSA